MDIHIKTSKLTAKVFAVAGLFMAAGCGDAGLASEHTDSRESALEECVLGPPVITELREETPGPVAAGFTKTYHVTVRNSSGAGCSPATVSIVPDAFQFFRASVQPQTQAGVGPNGTANFRLEVTSDPSVPEGVTDFGFTVISSPGGVARSSVRYEVDFDSPAGCNRQAPQLSVDPASPPPVPLGTPITYRVTVRNVDNPECGPDVFTLIPDFVRFFAISTSGSAQIAPRESAVIEVTATAETMVAGVREIGFTLFGNRHGGSLTRGALRYEVR